MRRVRKNYIVLFVNIIALLALVQCSSKKYYADFKYEKKQVDTLVVLTPYVSIEFLKNKEFSKDYELEDSLTLRIYNKTIDNLSEKYRLVDCMLHTDSINKTELSNLFLNLDNIGKDSVLITPPFIQNLIKDNPNRYFLMVYFQGFYNAHFEPYYFQKQGMATNTLYINVGNNLCSSNMKMLIFDNQKNIVVFYDKDYSKNTDPRIFSLIEKMISDMLIPIYYK